MRDGSSHITDFRYKSEETYREVFVSNGLVYFREVDIPRKEPETEEDEITTTTTQVTPEEKHPETRIGSFMTGSECLYIGGFTVCLLAMNG